MPSPGIIRLQRGVFVWKRGELNRGAKTASDAVRPATGTAAVLGSLQLPWDYATKVGVRMRGTNTMLDMGTGVGEILASLAPFPPRVCTTESYPPNVVVARQRLEPLGVVVCDTTDCEGSAVLDRGDQAWLSMTRGPTSESR
jgi:hypothetical protein